MNENKHNVLEVIYKDNKVRPVLVIFPGGGYERTSPREAFPVSYEFEDIGVHRAIYFYRENKLKYPNIYIEALNKINSLINDPLISDIHLMGFSAGGHFAAMLATFFPQLFKSIVLCYPVITSKIKYIHEGSFRNLLINYDDKDKLSLEHRVSKYMPPVFIWHTKEDTSVKYENSLLFAESLKRCNVPYELHLFEHGPHGLSLIFKDEYDNKYKENRKWINLAKDFLKRNSIV